LTWCAAEISREQCAEAVFTIVVNLNRNRILGRLASKHFQRPPYDRGLPRNALTIRLKEYIRSRVSAQRSSLTSTDVTTLSAQIDSFHSSFLRLESSTLEEIVSATKCVVKEAFSITVDGFSLPIQLEAMGFPKSLIDTREIREVNKIANYWRICLSLAHLSRSYRLLFTRLRLETLEPYEPVSELGTKLKRFVHAEVQMVVFYETSSCAPWPRAIGASKEACFLCDSFIKAHGHFHLSKAHRQIFPQWTVPDRRDYSSGTLKRLQSTLAKVDQNVMEGVENARRSRSFRPFPLQSSINLHNPILPTASVTTVRSSESETTRTASPIRSPTMSKQATPGPAAKTRNFLDLDGVKLTEDSASTSAMDTAPLHLPSSVAVNQTVAADMVTKAAENLTSNNPLYASSKGSPSNSPMITFTSAIHTSLDWLSLHIQLEAGSPLHGNGAPIATGADSPFSRASVRLESVPSSGTVDWERESECLSIGDLMPGEEKLIVRPDSGDCCGREPKIEFILTNGPRNPVRVSCRWYID
jgi:hypothetical protein